MEKVFPKAGLLLSGPECEVQGYPLAGGWSFTGCSLEVTSRKAREVCLGTLECLHAGLEARGMREVSKQGRSLATSEPCQVPARD